MHVADKEQNHGKVREVRGGVNILLSVAWLLVTLRRGMQLNSLKKKKVSFAVQKATDPHHTWA